MMISIERLEEAMAACRASIENDIFVGIRLSPGGFDVSGSRVMGQCIATVRRKVTFVDVATCHINSLLKAVDEVAAELSAAKVVEAA